MEISNENNCMGNMPLSSISPDWDSHSTLIDTIVELEKLKTKILEGSTPPSIFFELKSIFHKLESLGSGRIEGNRTTLVDFVEQITDNKANVNSNVDEKLQEILNIEKAMRFIEDNIDTNTPITKAHLFEMHKIVTDGLSIPEEGRNSEGSQNPGNFRMTQVKIRGSKFCPPDFTQVNDYIDELLDFVNSDIDTRKQLLSIAIAHHRFACIHPFDNGNGRVVRLFTYALLIRYGFQVRDREVEDTKDIERVGRILNPSAVFCVDREKYYKMLDLADSGEEGNILSWCEYVLSGLFDEIKKIDRLLDYDYLKKEILVPAIRNSLEQNSITSDEYAVLLSFFRKNNEDIKASDIKQILNIDSSLKASRVIKRLREKGVLVPVEEGGRIYHVSLTNKSLMRSVVGKLEDLGFAPGLTE